MLYNLGLYRTLGIDLLSPPRSATMLTEPEQSSPLKEGGDAVYNFAMYENTHFIK